MLNFNIRDYSYINGKLSETVFVMRIEATLIY